MSDYQCLFRTHKGPNPLPAEAFRSTLNRSDSERGYVDGLEPACRVCLADRVCQECGSDILKTRTESWSIFLARIVCSRECARAAHSKLMLSREHRGDVPPCHCGKLSARKSRGMCREHFLEWVAERVEPFRACGFRSKVPGRSRAGELGKWELPEDGIVDMVAVRLAASSNTRRGCCGGHKVVRLTRNERLMAAEMIVRAGGTIVDVSIRLGMTPQFAKAMLDELGYDSIRQRGAYTTVVPVRKDRKREGSLSGTATAC